MDNLSCRYCGQSLQRLMLIALLQDLGAQTNNPADECWARSEGGEHDFSHPEREEA